MALGGVLAALAVVIMCLVGLIPLATYVCPIACILLLDLVRIRCSDRVAWAWWGAVSVLSILLGPDKEAALMFLALGFYPIIRPKIERMKLRLLVKLVVFNASTLSVYWLMIRLLGMEQVAAEFHEMGTAMLALTLVTGNFTFLLLDMLLKNGFRFRRRHR